MIASSYTRSAMASTLSNLLQQAALSLYPAPQPASPDDATSLSPLAVLPISNIVVTGSDVTFTCPEQNAVSSGIAAWARIVSNTHTICDLTAGASGSGADIILTDTQIWQGGFVSVTSATIHVQ